MYTWGYPLGHNGPSPLLSVGYLAGFQAYPLINGETYKRLVVNGAFNSGNSGGALFKANTNKVIGIVASKRIPILNQFQRNAINVLASNNSGIVYTATDEAGKQQHIVESQIVSQLLESFRELVQVMIGEAICSREIVKILILSASFLNQKGVEQENNLLHDEAIANFEEAATLIKDYFPQHVKLMVINFNLGKCYLNKNMPTIAKYFF